ncbi:ribosomal rna-processing protein 1 [Ophiostoma piceae UAMH 11346]|uniref:Ribosomal rna-processing protein 1 n=1 Tax=Ophiostoma piceae (strain UAMH 11346) TaxID=1262450 RepID=S3CCA7_OPHP1|nr:ribosomal rna-processing protein 1 [Ophiostoma piceae UAMH 11346]
MAPAAPNMPFIKNMASSDRKIRTQALDTLKTFLSTKYAAAYAAPLTFNDAEKLWAGLFYALWMADRAPVQQRLCAEIADIPASLKLPNASVAAWLRAFWATMARQWTTGIDVLRMDKFLLLVRRVLASQFVWMAGVVDEEGNSTAVAAEEGSDLTEAQTLGLSILTNWPFNVDAEARTDETTNSSSDEDDDDDDTVGDDMVDIDNDGNERPRKRSRQRKGRAPRKPLTVTVHLPVGLVIHVVDIWVDEAEKAKLFVSKVADSNGKDTLGYRVHVLVEALAAKTTFPAVRQRSREALEDERLPWNTSSAETTGGIEGVADDDDADSNDGSWDGFND